MTDHLIRDLKFSLRTLSRAPTFTLGTVLTLALGIGATVAIFTVVNGVLLRPLNYADPGRLVSVFPLWQGKPANNLSWPNFKDLHDQAGLFGAMAGYNGGEIGVRFGDQAEFTTVSFVTPEFLNVFRIAPVAGRLFSPEEMKPNGPMAALLGSELAERRFGSIENALGRRVSVMGHDARVVGVLPAGFHYPDDTAVWIAQVDDGTASRDSGAVRGVARLRPNVTIEQAQTRLTAIGTRLAAAYPKSNKGESFSAIELRNHMVGRYRPTLGLLGAAVALLFLIACANVASIMLARASARGREIAVRAAIGASRWQILRQLIVESSMLALLAGAAGFAFGWWLTKGLVALAPAGIPRLDEISIDIRVLLFAVVATALSTVLFGVAPALASTRVDLNEALRQGGLRGVLGGGSGRLRSIIASAQIALCFVMITGAMLLFRSFMDLTNTDMGFRPDHVLVTYAAVPAETLAQNRAAASFFVSLRHTLEALPGVKSAAAVMGLPTGRYGSDGGYQVMGQPRAASFTDMPYALFRVNTPGYFTTLGIPLRHGRDFDDHDTYDSQLVAVVSEGLVRQSFGGKDPIGQRIQCGLDLTSMKTMLVIGVAGDVRSDDPGHPPEPVLYMPALQHPYFANEMQVVVRTVVPPLSLEASVRSAIHSARPDTSLQFTTLDEMLAASVASPRFRTVLLAVFAAIALALVLAGVYGLMSYTVELRSSELGLRMALGAQARDVGLLVLRRAFEIAAWGLGVGALLALVSRRLLAGMLYQVTAADPFSWVAALALMAVVAALAALIPARRAIRLDPVVTLRSE